jgi:uncharacterized protein (UPF0303 family)
MNGMSVGIATVSGPPEVEDLELVVSAILELRD